MSQTSERAKTRLDNLAAIEPLLGALRTISMGTWQMAQHRLAEMQRYEQNYSRVLSDVLPQIHQQGLPTEEPLQKRSGEASAIALIIGTERGLCGKFNEALADQAVNWIASEHQDQAHLWVMGSRLAKALEKRKLIPDWFHPLPAGDLLSYTQAYQMTQSWLDEFEDWQFNSLTLLYNQSQRGGRLQFSTLPLLPYQLQTSLSEPTPAEENWPPPIIETDPKGIYHQIVLHFIASSFYQVLLKSAIAEHASRFHMMEEAKKNADEIMAELYLVINAERKRKITQDMQELAVGAGLIDNR